MPRYKCPKGHTHTMEETTKTRYCCACDLHYVMSDFTLITNTPRDSLLVEREKTHGSFSRNANAWNHFIKAMNDAAPMKAEQSMALHMIFVKLSRALQNPEVKDHWDDIAGYAKLGSEACDGS